MPSGLKIKRYGSYIAAQNKTGKTQQAVLSGNTLFPEAMDVLEMMGVFSIRMDCPALSTGEALLERFDRLCRHLPQAQVRWVDTALAEIGYALLMDDVLDKPDAYSKTTLLGMLKSLAQSRHPDAFLKHLGAVKHYCVQSSPR